MRNIPNEEIRTSVQEAADFCREIDFRCDAVMVYGLVEADKKIRHWMERGYTTQLMVGYAWGEYQDYLNRRFDGEDHHDEAQMTSDLKIMDHGKVANTAMTTDTDIPYMVPAISFVDYLIERIKPLIDLGVRQVFFEEPELFTASGYSALFRREWKAYYKEPWQDPRSSESLQYKASRLKQYLYVRAFRRISEELKDYTMKKYDEVLEVYAGTHPPLNYTQWNIVSPESALIDIPTVDGVIGQTWTDSIRLPNTYRGRYGVRPFETAFLDYSSTVEMLRGSGKKAIFIHDAVQDDKSRSWSDYRRDYYRTVSASLMYPEVWRYEVSPWPNRVMNVPFTADDHNGTCLIPDDYRQNLLTLFNLYRDMKRDDCGFLSGNTEAGILFSDTAMYQRVYPQGSGFEQLSEALTFDAFYGMALPLVKHGMALRVVNLDNVLRISDYLFRYKTLVLSYEFMKPADKMMNLLLADWVRRGGTLMYVGDGSDTYHSIRSWWNSGENGNTFRNPSEHLFEACDLGRVPEEGLYRVGRGHIYVFPVHPSHIAQDGTLCDDYLRIVDGAMEAAGTPWNRTPFFAMKRGPYVSYAVLDETDIAAPQQLQGQYVDLFSSELDVLRNPVLKVGSVGLLYDLSYRESEPASLIAVSGRSDQLKVGEKEISFTVMGTLGVAGKGMISCRAKPRAVEASVDIAWEYSEESETVAFRFGAAEGPISFRFLF